MSHRVLEMRASAEVPLLPPVLSVCDRPMFLTFLEKQINPVNAPGPGVLGFPWGWEDVASQRAGPAGADIKGGCAGPGHPQLTRYCGGDIGGAHTYT